MAGKRFALSSAGLLGFLLILCYLTWLLSRVQELNNLAYQWKLFDLLNLTEPEGTAPFFLLLPDVTDWMKIRPPLETLYGLSVLKDQPLDYPWLVILYCSIPFSLFLLFLSFFTIFSPDLRRWRWLEFFLHTGLLLIVNLFIRFATIFPTAFPSSCPVDFSMGKSFVVSSPYSNWFWFPVDPAITFSLTSSCVDPLGCSPLSISLLAFLTMYRVLNDSLDERDIFTEVSYRKFLAHRRALEFLEEKTPQELKEIEGFQTPQEYSYLHYRSNYHRFHCFYRLFLVFSLLFFVFLVFILFRLTRLTTADFLLAGIFPILISQNRRIIRKPIMWILKSKQEIEEEKGEGIK